MRYSYKNDMNIQKQMSEKMLLFLTFLIFYLSLAYFTRGLFKIQFHSIVHCINAVLLSSYFYYFSNISLISINVIKQMNFAYNDFIYICASNSNGYFVADSIDIFLDNKNIKRKVYIRHHIMAILGISTVYLGDNKFILAIWCLEIGGILHHIKYMSEVYSFNYFFRIFSII